MQNNISWLTATWARVTIIGVTILGATLGLILALTQSKAYASTATIYLPPDVSRALTNSTDPAAQRAELSTFVATAESDEVASLSAQKLGTQRHRVQEGLSVTSTASSNDILITFESQSRNFTERASKVVTEQALAEYTARNLTVANQQMGVYQRQYDASTKAVNDLVNRSEEPDPSFRMQALLNQVTSLQAQLASGGDGTRVTQDQLTSLRSEVTRLQPILLQYRELTAAQSRTNDLLKSAQGHVYDLQAAQTPATLDNSVVVSAPKRVSQLRSIARVAITGALVGVTVALLLVAGAIVVRPSLASQRNGRHAEEAPTAP